MTRPEQFAGIIALTREVYVGSAPWNERQLQSHIDVFGEGQFVALCRRTGQVVGMAASLIVRGRTTTSRRAGATSRPMAISPTTTPRPAGHCTAPR
jgi:hypothetical protein